MSSNFMKRYQSLECRISVLRVERGTKEEGPAQNRMSPYAACIHTGWFPIEERLNIHSTHAKSQVNKDRVARNITAMGCLPQG